MNYGAGKQYNNYQNRYTSPSRNRPGYQQTFSSVKGGSSYQSSNFGSRSGSNNGSSYGSNYAAGQMSPTYQRYPSSPSRQTSPSRQSNYQMGNLSPRSQRLPPIQTMQSLRSTSPQRFGSRYGTGSTSTTSGSKSGCGCGG